MQRLLGIAKKMNSCGVIYTGIAIRTADVAGFLQKNGISATLLSCRTGSESTECKSGFVDEREGFGYGGHECFWNGD